MNYLRQSLSTRSVSPRLIGGTGFNFTKVIEAYNNQKHKKGGGQQEVPPHLEPLISDHKSSSGMDLNNQSNSTHLRDIDTSMYQAFDFSFSNNINNSGSR